MDFLNRKFISVLRDLREEVSSLRESIDASRNQQERHHQEDKAKAPIEQHPITHIRGEIDTHKHKSKTGEGDDDSGRNRDFWVQVAIASGTWGAFLAAALYAGLTYCMLHSVQQQTRIQRDVGVNSERAWVGLDVPVTLDGISSYRNDVLIQGHYNIKNIGHGPAFKVMQFGNFVDTSSNKQMQDIEANSFCDSSVKFATGTVPVGGSLRPFPPFGFTLFPNQYREYPIRYQGDLSAVKFFRFIGCVAYVDQFNDVHWTRFCMERSPGDNSRIPRLEFCSLYNDTDEPKKH